MNTYKIYNAERQVINTIVSEEQFAIDTFGLENIELISTVISYNKPTLVITSITSEAGREATTFIKGVTEVTCLSNTTLTVTAELRDSSGNIIPLTDSFRLPLKSRDFREKVLLAVMTNGVASINAPLRESGIWSVTEEMINESLPKELQMNFDGITIYVIES